MLLKYYCIVPIVNACGYPKVEVLSQKLGKPSPKYLACTVLSVWRLLAWWTHRASERLSWIVPGGHLPVYLGNINLELKLLHLKIKVISLHE